MQRKEIERLGEDKCRKIYNNIISTHNLVNITQVKGKDLNIIDTNKFQYILTYSFPCITNDSLILTKNGYKKFQDLLIGEYVLTKSNTWQKIIKKFDNGIHETFFLQGMGFENIHCTENHKFYVRTKSYKGHFRKRVFSEPQFKEAKDITKNDYFGIPVNKENEFFYTNDKDFWYIIGYYLGDGWLSKQSYDIKLCANDKKLEKLLPYLKNYKYTINKEKTIYKVRFANKKIYSFIKENIGSGANQKRICGEILRMSKENLKFLLQGYLDSDGCIIKNNYQFTSINRNLIYSISFIANKIYHCPTKIYKVKVKSKKIICDREVNQKDWYMLRYKINVCKQDNAFYENGYIWYPFTKIIKANEEHVYNMEIENDHSYIIQGAISKNCQDLSLAGLQKGMTKGSETRSSLLWEVERILDELSLDNTELPILLMENVPRIHSQQNIADFKKWILKLEKLGYTNFCEDVNSKNYGIPQNRVRTFCLSIPRKEIAYNFLPKIKLKKYLFDLLEPNVDKKYFLSKKKIKDIINWNAYQKPFETMERLVDSGIAPTITTRSGEYTAGMILVPTVLGGFGKKVNNEKQYHQQNRIYDNKIAISLTTSFAPWYLCKLGIRKLTPREYFRLMGVKDEDFEKIKTHQTESSLYHLAGDSIVTTSLIAVLGNLFKNINLNEILLAIQKDI